MDRYAIALGKKPPPAVPLDKVSDKEWVDIRRKQQQNENITREFLQYFAHPAETNSSSTGQMIAQREELQRMQLEQQFNNRATYDVFNDRYIQPAARALARNIDQAAYEAMRDGNWNTDRTP